MLWDIASEGAQCMDGPRLGSNGSAADGMNLRHMEVFRAVYHARSISGAARSLAISQPSVSRMVRSLEDRLGYPLFSLRKGRIVPTREADRLVAEVDGVFEAVGRVDRMARDLRQGAFDRVAVVAVTSIAVGILPEALREVAARFPRVPISLDALNLADQIGAVARADADLGIAINVPPLAGFERRRLANAHFVAVLHKDHPYAARDMLALADFAVMPTILPPPGSPLGKIVHGAFAAARIGPMPSVTVNSPIPTGALIRAFRGLSILDGLTARLIGDPDLVVRPLAEPIAFPVHAFWQEPAKLSLPQMDLVERVEAHLRQLLAPAHAAVAG